MQICIGHGDTRLQGGCVYDALIDELIQHRLTQLRTVQQGLIYLTTHTLPQRFLTLAQGFRIFSSGDARARYFGNLVGRVTAAKIEVDAEKRERDREQAQNDACDDSATLDEVEHGLWHSQTEKANSRSPFGKLAEWTGLEPATPGVTGRYSNQLNYHSSRFSRSSPPTATIQYLSGLLASIFQVFR